MTTPILATDLGEVVRWSVPCWLHDDRTVVGAVYTKKRGWLWCCAECFDEAYQWPATERIIRV